MQNQEHSSQKPEIVKLSPEIRLLMIAILTLLLSIATAQGSQPSRAEAVTQGQAIAEQVQQSQNKTEISLGNDVYVIYTDVPDNLEVRIRGPKLFLETRLDSIDFQSCLYGINCETTSLLTWYLETEENGIATYIAGESLNIQSNDHCYNLSTDDFDHLVIYNSTGAIDYCTEDPGNTELIEWSGRTNPTATPTATLTPGGPTITATPTSIIPTFTATPTSELPTPTHTPTPTSIPGENKVFVPFILSKEIMANCQTVEIEPNGTLDQADNNLPACLNLPLFGKHNEPSDFDDFFRFDNPEVRTIQINLIGISVPINLYLYDVNGNQVARSIQPGTEDESILVDLPVGRYYIRTFRSGSEVSEVPYTLEVIPQGNESAYFDTSHTESNASFRETVTNRRSWQNALYNTLHVNGKAQI